MIACATDAETHLEAARRELVAARRAFEQHPDDLSRERVVDAEVAHEDALAIASEWVVCEPPTIALVIAAEGVGWSRRIRGLVGKISDAFLPNGEGRRA